MRICITKIRKLDFGGFIKKACLLLLFLTVIPSLCFADMRVCFNKSTGKLIESQSGGKVEVTNEMAEAQLIAEGVKDITTALIEEKYTILRKEADSLELARLMTLKYNALSHGYSEADIEVKYITDAEHKLLMDIATAPTAEQILELERESKIKAMMRTIAIERLQGQGELIGYTE